MPDEPTAPQAETGTTSRLVCIGSSAGGLEALFELLRSLPSDLDCGYVIAQHLSPEHDSPMAELLARDTELIVRVAEDGATLEKGVVLVAPADTDIQVDRSQVRLTPPLNPRSVKPSIDLLMRSLAEHWGPDAVAIVLSGTGEDGSAGMRSVHSAGGLTIAQRPSTAKFASMPEAAIATGTADLVLPPSAVGRVLATPLADLDMLDTSDPEQPAHVGHIDAIVEALVRVGGVDFGEYKRTTLARQIARRQALVQIDELADYRAKIENEPEEVRALMAMLFVTVTSFFRDGAVWEALKQHLRQLVKTLEPETQIRIWVPGCATGQEAYTIAMVAAGVLAGGGELRRRLKVFATDLDDSALDVARRGRYVDDEVQAIPTALRVRWMHRVADDWEISPDLRDCVVLARHNVTADPPFPRVHLISLRNTLIYFQPQMQDRVLKHCHFALVPGGILVLGEAERVNPTRSDFVPLDKERIYRRRTVTGRIVTPAHVPPEPTAPVQASASVPLTADVRTLMHQALIHRFAPALLVVDENDEVVEVVGDVSPWCWVAEGRHSRDVVALLREPLRPTVRSLLMRLRHGGLVDVEHALTTEGGLLTIRAGRLRGADDGSVVVSFTTTVAAPVEGDGADSDPGAADPEVVRISAELESTQTALQATIEELGASNEELLVMNEELQSSSEELQASNEEVHASNEELEATNEQLSTLNQVLQVRGTELVQLNTELENIQDSLTSGLVLVDLELRITRFTPLSVRLFSLIDADIGRPLTAVPTTTAIPGLEQHLRATVASKASTILEVPGNQIDFLVQLQPYLSVDGTVRGAVVVVLDVSELARAQREVARTLENFTKVTESIRETVWQRDSGGRLRFLNGRVETFYGLDRDRVLEDPSLLLSAVHPDDRDRVARVTAAATGQWEIEYRIVRPDGSVRWIEESTVPMTTSNGESYTIGSAIDVTDRHHIEVQAHEHRSILRTIMSNAVFGVLVLDVNERIIEASPTFARVMGFDAASLVGTPVSLLGEPDFDEIADEMLDDLEVGVAEGIQQRRLVDSEGRPHLVSMESRPLEMVEGQEAAQVIVIHDVTRLREISQSLELQGQFDNQTGLMSRSYFRKRVADQLAVNDGIGVALLWIDLDGFKEVNDRFGHRAGDKVLIEIAGRLQATARKGDLIGRLGGDEFAILVSNVDKVDVLESVADRFLSALRAPITIAESAVFVTASIGIAISPEDGSEPEVLMHNADTAMYSAKQEGHDRHAYFQPEMNRAADARADMRQKLSLAIRRRDFVMHYQPIVDVGSGELRMLEALVRWDRDGTFAPARNFITLAEETGQMRALGRIVLEMIDNDLGTLDEELGDQQVPVALNLSVAELEERDLVDWILAWKPAGGFDRVVAEITESIRLAPGSRAFETLALLKRLGATLSIDDFGMAYSNFEVLSMLRPGIIKIDRSLLVRTEEGARSVDLFGAAVQMVHALDAKVVAEGVENEAHWATLGNFAVDLAQGYHIARPKPLADMITWIDEHRN